MDAAAVLSAPPAELLVYGVVRTPRPEDGAAAEVTVEGHAVEVVASGPVSAVVSTLAAERTRARRADLLAYHAVLDALAARGALAPVRFGTVLPDRAAVGEFLARERERLLAVLDHLEGRRQYNLRVGYVEEAVLADLVAGDREIRELRDRTRDLPEEASYPDRIRLGELVTHALEARSAQDAQALLAAVVPHVVEHRLRSDPSATQVLDVALLVDDEHASALVDRLEELARVNHEQLRLRLVGPLAAHDFAEGAAWA